MNLINHPQKCYYIHIHPQTVNKEQVISIFHWIIREITAIMTINAVAKAGSAS